MAHLGTASDIIDLYSMLTEASHPDFVYVLLGFWSWSLFQFPFVVTSTKVGEEVDRIDEESEEEDEEDDESTKYQRQRKIIKKKLTQFAILVFETEAWAIFVSIIMQHGPFVFIRLVAIVKYGIITYTNYFFVAKNTLVFTLQLYWVFSLYVEHKKAKERAKAEKRRELMKTKVVEQINLQRSKEAFMSGKKHIM